MSLSGNSIVEVIVEMKAAGAPARDIAVVFGCSARTMQRMLKPRYGRLDDEERALVITFVHRLSHDDGKSVRAIVADLASKGIPRMAMSVGWVHGALREWRCTDCSNAPHGVSEQTGTAVGTVHSRQMAQVNGGAR